MASKRGSKWKTFLVQRVPFCDWIVRYSKEDAVGDIIAGITICLTMVPQSIAYAALAGLDPQYGLNSAFVGCFVYVFFGTIKEVVIGPSSLLALLTYEYTRHLNVDFVILLCFLSGVVELLMGMLHLGFLVSFISAPVVSGFTSATSIIIVVSQIGGLLGIRTEASGFIGKIRKIVENAKYFRWGDAILGFACIAACLLLRKLKHVEIDPARPSYGFVNKLCWFLSIGRNFLAVFLSSCIAVVYNHYYESTPFKMTKAVESGVPSFQLPPMSTQIGNQTYNFTEMVVELGAGYFVIPVVSVLANVAIAKAFAKGTVDATQEMLALSMSNMLGSCFQSLPTNGAFTRSAVMSASGVRTPLAGFYSAFLTMTALQFLGPYFHCIPRASLSAILIAAVIFLIDWEIIMPLWRCKKFDLCALVATFVFCLYLGVEVGILFGVIISLADLVYKWYKVQVTILQNKGPNGSYIILQPSLPLFFPSVDHLSSVIIKTAENRVEDTIPIVIDCRTVRNSDYSVAKSTSRLECPKWYCQAARGSLQQFPHFHYITTPFYVLHFRWVAKHIHIVQLHALAFASLTRTFEKRGQILVFMDVPDKTKKIWKTAGCKDSIFCSSITVDQFVMGQNSSMLNIKKKCPEEGELEEDQECMMLPKQ